ncbi:MAG: type II toxin-antitoxin system HicA family toxin [Planctomycetota bacterium]
MKRAKLLRHLRQQGMVFLREGGRHSIWMNPDTRHTEAVPRHTEIGPRLVRVICKNLDIDPPAEK